MRVAAWQAPLFEAGSFDALKMLPLRVEWCEAHEVTILCCPEAILGGLADYSADPTTFAVPVKRLGAILAPLASDNVSVIVGFTELGDHGSLLNSAALFHRGSVAGVYRKLHPAIRRSVYAAGGELPLFRIDDLTFGIIICNDSNYSEPARLIAAQGATALFVPSNNALPPARASAELIEEARKADIARAVENNLWVIRADVAGRNEALVSYGSSGIVDPTGTVVHCQHFEDLLIVDIPSGSASSTC